VLFEVLLISIEHAIEPWQKLLGAMVGVQDNRDAVRGSDCADVVGGSNSSGDRGLLLVVLDTLQVVLVFRIQRGFDCSPYLASKIRRATLGGLENDGSFGITSGLEGSNNG
jgi:hypothetical protein